MYSLDHFIATPPLSAIFSLLLITGCDALGLICLPFFGMKKPAYNEWQRWQAPVVGTMILGIILYPLALYGITTILFMRSFATACMLLGAWQLVKLITGFIKSRRVYLAPFDLRQFSNNGWNILLLGIFGGMFLVAFGPVTDADSLDYHMGIPIALLNHGGMPVVPEWFSGRLAGNGEVLNALGLSIGAEQFGSLMQFSGILSITGLLLFAESADENSDPVSAQRKRTFIAVAVISAPVILGLISPKPQLLPIAMTTLAFALLLFPSRRQLTRKQAVAGFTLICLLVMYASQTKLTYMLGGGIIGMLAIILMAKQKLFLPAIFIASTSAVLILLPPVIWKHIHFNAGFIQALTRPLPGDLPGTNSFEAYLRAFRDTDMPFPLSLLLPSGFGTLTTVIGMGLLLLVTIRPKRDPWLLTGVGIAIVVAVTAALLGPKTSRSYLEPFFWLAIVVALQPSPNFIYNSKLFKLPFLAQALITLLLCIYGIITLFPGAITPGLRVRVMNQSANGYTILRWADSVLPSNAVLLNTHRSMALSPRNAINYDWSTYVDLTKKESSTYIKQLRDKKVTHVIITGPPPHDLGKLTVCITSVFAGPFYGHLATRNPVNRGKLYEAWIYHFDASKLPDPIN